MRYGTSGSLSSIPFDNYLESVPITFDVWASSILSVAPSASGLGSTSPTGFHILRHPPKSLGHLRHTELALVAQDHHHHRVYLDKLNIQTSWMFYQYNREILHATNLQSGNDTKCHWPHTPQCKHIATSAYSFCRFPSIDSMPARHGLEGLNDPAPKCCAACGSALAPFFLLIPDCSIFANSPWILLYNALSNSF